jgi:hypothetical protein
MSYISNGTPLLHPANDHRGNLAQALQETANGSVLVTATGSPTARTLAQRAADVENVLDFGCVCDGITDNFVALAAMVTSIGTTAKTIIVPGPCLSSGSVAIPRTAPVRFEGSGRLIGPVTYWTLPVLMGLTASDIDAIQLYSGGGTTLDGLTVGQRVPSAATAFQANGLAVFQQTDAASPNVVGIYSQSLAGVNNAKVWGLNPVVNDFDLTNVQHTGVTLHGAEIDVNSLNGSTAGDAIFIQGNLGTNANMIGIYMPKPLVGRWSAGLVTGDGAVANAGVQLGSINAAPSSASQKIILFHRTAGGVSTPTSIQVDSAGFINLNSDVRVSSRVVVGAATEAGAAAGDIVIPNGLSVRGDTPIHNATFPLIGANSSNEVALDSGGQGVRTGGPLTLTGRAHGPHFGASVSADRGDTSQTLTVAGDVQIQRWATALTVNRTVTLSTTGAINGDTFRVVRTGLGAFTLDVGPGLKVIPNTTAAFVDVTFDGVAWQLTGYGLL